MAKKQVSNYAMTLAQKDNPIPRISAFDDGILILKYTYKLIIFRSNDCRKFNQVPDISVLFIMTNVASSCHCHF
jgi:hypothetical protein